MLDWLLRWATPRNLVIVILAGAAVPPSIKLARYARWRYERSLYPPVRPEAGAGQDIKALLDKRESEKIELRFRKVGGLILQAKAAGHDVAALEDRANEALAYNVPGRRETAAEILNEVEMAVPRPKVQYIPLYNKADDNNMPDDDTPQAKPKPVAKTAPPPAAKKKGKRGR